MPFPFDEYPWAKFEDLNIAYMIHRLGLIISEANAKLEELDAWKTATEQDLENWKNSTMDLIAEWEREFMADVHQWEHDTEQDLEQWKIDTIAALYTWKATFITQYEALRVEVEHIRDVASAAAQEATQAATTASAAATRAENAAASTDPYETMVAYGGPGMARGIYLEEGDESATNLYFRINALNLTFYRNGTQTAKTMANIASDLEASLVTSAKGITNCLLIPNNNALVFDPTDNKMKFVLRNAVAEPMVPLFFNTYGRAENPHPIIIENRLFQMPFVNVRQFGARGSGQVDDTQAFQDALNYLRSTGGTLWVPRGTYLINTILWDAGNSSISAALHIFNNIHLMMDKNAVLKRGANVNHLMFTHNESGQTGYGGAVNIEISGGTFDDNSSVGSNSTPLNTSHGNRIYIHDVHFVNAHAENTWHFIEVNSSANVKIENCSFVAGAGKTEDIQIDVANGLGNLGASDGTVCHDIDIIGCRFESGAHPAIGNHVNAAHHNIRISECRFTANNPRGAVDFMGDAYAVDMYNCTIYRNTSALRIGASQPSCILRDCRLENVATPVINCIAHNNMINGVWTA